MYGHILRTPRSEFGTAAIRWQRRQPRYSQHQYLHEYEKTPRKVWATIAWRRASIKQMASLPGGGVYIVEKNKTPIYVGETKNFRGRWRARYRVLRELKADLRPYSVWWGRIAPEGFSRTLARTDRTRFRNAIERVLIRYLKRKGFELVNKMSIRPFRVESPGVNLTNYQGPRYLASKIRPKIGQEYELFKGRPLREEFEGIGSYRPPGN